MAGQDKIKDFLNQKLSGYAPQRPENDWNQFRKKFVLKQKKFKRNLGFASLTITFILLLIGLFSNNEFNLDVLTQKGVEVPLVENVINGSAAQADIPAGDKQNTELSDKPVVDATNKNAGSVVIPLNNDRLTVTDMDVNGGVNAKIISKDFAVTNEKLPGITDFNLSKEPKNEIIVKEKRIDYLPLKSPLFNVPKPLIPRREFRFPSFLPKSIIIIKYIASSTYSSRGIEIPAANAGKVHEDYEMLAKESKKGSLGFSQGVQVELALGKWLSIGSGLVQESYKSENTYAFFNNRIPVIDSATKEILGYITIADTSGVFKSVSNKSDYFVIPLTVSYRLAGVNRFSVDLKAAGSYMYLLKAAEETIDPATLKMTEVSGERYNKSNLGLSLGLRCNYELSGLITVGIEPVYNRVMGPVYKKDVLVKIHPWSAGLNFSVMLKL